MNRRCSLRWLLTLGIGTVLAHTPAFANPLKSVAKTLAKGTRKLKNPRVAVLVFPYDNGDLSSGSTLVSEQLTSFLAQRRGLRIIERSRLASVLGEMKLEESGISSSSASAQLGGI